MRVGISSYGLAPAARMAFDTPLRPVMTLRGRLAGVKRVPPGTSVSYGHRYTTDRETTLGLVPLGYAEGLPRNASNRVQAAFAGQRVRLVGTICMDQVVVDLGDLPAERGDVVTLFGPGDDGEPTRAGVGGRRRYDHLRGRHAHRRPHRTHLPRSSMSGEPTAEIGASHRPEPSSPRESRPSSSTTGRPSAAGSAAARTSRSARSTRATRKVVSADGIRINVEVDEPELEAPHLPTIVFVHGVLCTLDSWHYQRLALRGQVRMVFMDQRSHGASDVADRDSSTIENLAADLHAVIEACTRPTCPRSCFVHGILCTLDTWHYQRLALRGQVRMVFMDQRSHGASDVADRESSTIENLAADLLAVLQACTDGPVVLVGHSMGGMTIMQLAADHPELFGDQVVGVVLLSTSSRLPLVSSTRPCGASSRSPAARPRPSTGARASTASPSCGAGVWGRTPRSGTST